MGSGIPEALRPFIRPTRRLLLTPGDAGPAPVTKIGGAPWWPRDRPRPACGHGHQMAFIAQVRLSDVPAHGDDALLSFHYCLECADEGRMSFGRSEAQAGQDGYVVARIAVDATGPDEKGIVAPTCLPSMGVAFAETDEVLGLEDAWALELELPPDLFSEGEDDLDENIGLGLVHVARSKIGGWPHWQQTPEWPTCSEGRRMRFVLQLDHELGEEAPWAGGGYAYLFACGPECVHPGGELVIQTA